MDLNSHEITKTKLEKLPLGIFQISCVSTPTMMAAVRRGGDHISVGPQLRSPWEELREGDRVEGGRKGAADSHRCNFNSIIDLH